MGKREKPKKKYSYIKKSYAKSGWYSFGIGLAVWMLSAGAMLNGVRTNGQSGLTAAACGLSAFLLSLMGLWFAKLSFAESGRNYLFARIGGSMSGLCMLFWVVITGIGMA